MATTKTTKRTKTAKTNFDMPKKLSKIGEYLIKGKPILEGYEIVDMRAVLK